MKVINQTVMTLTATAFQIEFERRRKELVEDTRKSESKRNETGNLWKHSLKKALEAAGFTVVLEHPHVIFDNGVEFDKLKSDVSVFYETKLIAVIESKDYFSIDYVRRAACELSEICKSHNCIGFLFQGRKAYGNNDRAVKWVKKYGQNIEIITMIDDQRRLVNGALQTTINTDFDVKYDRVNNIINKLNEIIQR